MSGRCNCPRFQEMGRCKHLAAAMIAYVKNIRSFLEDVCYGRTTALGKNVSLDHSIGQFDDSSKALIRILMNEYPESRSMGRGYASGFGYQNYNSQKNEIVLTGDSFDRWVPFSFVKRIPRSR